MPVCREARFAGDARRAQDEKSISITGVFVCEIRFTHNVILTGKKVLAPSKNFLVTGRSVSISSKKP